MSTARAGTPGATRVCPHCKAVVLESAAVCPGCRHHLRFNATDAQFAAAEAYCAFNIEGTIAHKQSGEHCEYCIVLDIRNERGEQILRQVVGVGALHPGELRRLNLAVEMLPVRAAVPSKNEPPGARDPRRSPAPGIAARAPGPSPVPAPSPVPGTAPPPGATPVSSTAAAATTPSRAPAAPSVVSPPGSTTKSPAASAAPASAAATVSSAPTKAPAPAPGGQTRRPAGERAAAEPGALSDQLRLFRKP